MISFALIAGTRPNFIKIASLISAINTRSDCRGILIHAGQHYSSNMSDVFFEDLNLPKPDVQLRLTERGPMQRLTEMYTQISAALRKIKPDAVFVVGDVDATLAGAMAAQKLSLPILHVEAGLRSHDKRMPEEENRVFVDSFASMLFTTEAQCEDLLLKEGYSANNIYFTGNTMMDTLIGALRIIDQQPHSHGQPENHVLVTLHRSEHVRDKAMMQILLEELRTVSLSHTILWPIHPHTRKQIKHYGFDHYLRHITTMEPQRYLDFIRLMRSAGMIITDSGGVQEESTFLNIPCFTLRESTERPITVQVGTNTLVPPRTLKGDSLINLLNNPKKRKSMPPLWDGKAGKRIIDIAATNLPVT